MSLKELSSGKHPPEGRKPRRLPRLKTPVGTEGRVKDNMFFYPEGRRRCSPSQSQQFSEKVLAKRGKRPNVLLTYLGQVVKMQRKGAALSE